METEPDNDVATRGDAVGDETIIGDSLENHAIADEEAINDALASIPPLPSTEDAADQQQQVQVVPANNIPPSAGLSIKDFARSLKVTDDASTTIRSFDNEAFLSKCNRSSIHYDPTIHITELASELFVKNEVWNSKDLLFDALTSFASVVGCKSIRSRDVIKLKSRIPNVVTNMTTSSSSSSTADRDEGFYVKLRALHNEKKSPATPRDPRKSVAKARPVWEKEVQIREVRTVLPQALLKRKAHEMMTDDNDDNDVVDNCPSTVFARALKRMDGVTMIIMGFDEKTFEDKCMPYVVSSSSSEGMEVRNPNHDDRYDMDLMARELFKQNDVWVNRDVLFHALSCFASVFGFKVVKSRYDVMYFTS